MGRGWRIQNPGAERVGLARVVVGPDEICLPCPQWQGGSCARGFEKLNRTKDAEFLRLLALADGSMLRADDLRRRLCTRATPAFFRRVCAGCSPEECARVAANIGPTLW